MDKIKESKPARHINKHEKEEDKIFKDEKFGNYDSFTELTPLYVDVDNEPQRDLTSIDIKSFDFPKIVYMIINKKIELETKALKDYPEWQFLSDNDLNRRTLEIFLDVNSAKKACNKDQKVIKVPNPEVFKLVAPILSTRGITRIISDDKLIAL